MGLNHKFLGKWSFWSNNQYLSWGQDRVLRMVTPGRDDQKGVPFLVYENKFGSLPVDDFILQTWDGQWLRFIHDMVSNQLKRIDTTPDDYREATSFKLRFLNQGPSQLAFKGGYLLNWASVGLNFSYGNQPAKPPHQFQFVMHVPGEAAIRQSGSAAGYDFSPVGNARVDLSYADFSGVNFEKANLQSTILSQVNLRGANLTEAKLNGANVNSLNLTDLSPTQQTNLTGTDFSGLDLTNPPVYFSPNPKFSTDQNKLTNFTNATLDFKVINLNWSYLNLTNATIRNIPRDRKGRLALSDLVAQFANLMNIRLPQAILRGAKFDNSTMTGANLSDADLTNASLTSVWLEGGAQEEVAKLSGALMFNTKLSSAHLSGVDLSGAYLYGQNATVDGATMTLVKMANAYLANMSFSNVPDLKGADFTGACLVNANFGKAILTEYVGPGVRTPVSFFGACLQGANFAQSQLFGANLNRAAIATAAGSLPVTLMIDGAPFPMTVPYPNPTQLPASTTGPTTVCPNRENGPCTAEKLISPRAPTKWPSLTLRKGLALSSITEDESEEDIKEGER
jgi:uncharacterized protein YjbI with pentapeptide repeats